MKNPCLSCDGTQDREECSRTCEKMKKYRKFLSSQPGEPPQSYLEEVDMAIDIGLAIFSISESEEEKE